MNDANVRIFVSSPADVEPERAMVKDIIERLAQEFLPYFRIESIFWEEEALTADRTFQAGMVRPADCDIVLVVLWTRLGSPLPQDPYKGRTGTEWEFFDAVDASGLAGLPEVLVYRKTNPKLVDITNPRGTLEALEDHKRLEEFFQQNFFNEDKTFRRAFRTFESEAAFRNLVDVQLRKLLNRRIFVERRGAGRAFEWRGSPFRADGPFEFGDERVFTGREVETREMLVRLHQQKESGIGLLLVSGPSGSGKTSLMRAGLLPRLVRPHQVPGVVACRWCLLDPGQEADPLATMAAALCAPDVLGDLLRGFGVGPGLLRRTLEAEPELALSQIQAALAALTRGFRDDTGETGVVVRLAVVVDPLERLFSWESPRATRAFVTALETLARSGVVWVLALMRSDRLPSLGDLGSLAGLIDRHSWIRLEPLPGVRARQVVEIPALVAGLQYESVAGQGLADLLEAEASRLRHWPPLLQGVLERLYRGLDGAEPDASVEDAGPITVHALRADGGLAGDALRRADRVWERQDGQTRAALPRFCRALIDLEPTGARRPIPRTADLGQLEAEPAGRSLLLALVDARLLVTDAERDPVLLKPCSVPDYSFRGAFSNALRETRQGWRARRHRDTGLSGSELLDLEPPDEEGMSEEQRELGQELDWQGYRRVVTLAHPVLLSRWGPMADWLGRQENREDLLLRNQISRQARLWKRTDCNREYLLGKAGFAAAERFRGAHGGELEPWETQLLDQSERYLGYQRRRRALVRAVGLVLVLLLVFATVAAFWASDASRTATVNLHRSRLNAANLAITRGNTPSAIVLALDAGRYLPRKSLETLSRAFSSNRLVAMAQAPGPAPHQPVSPAFSGDGNRLVVLAPGRGAVLLRLEGASFVFERDLGGADSSPHTLLFAGTGADAPVLAISADGVRRLPAEEGNPPDWPCGTPERMVAAVDPTGRYLALAHPDGNGGFGVCGMNLEHPGSILFDTPLHQEEIRSLVFSPDATRLLSASRDGLVRMLDAGSGEVLVSLPLEGPLRRPVNKARFDATGEFIVTAAADETVRVYGADGALLQALSQATSGGRVFRVHNTAVRDAVFSRDGRYILAVDDEGQVVRWDLEVEGSVVVLGHHALSVDQVQVGNLPGDDDAPLLLTASLDKTARLWDLDSGKELAVFSHDRAVTSARFSTGGDRILSYSDGDGSARVWSVAPVPSVSYPLKGRDHIWHLDLATAPSELAPEGGLLLIATGDFGGNVSVWRYQRGSDAPPLGPWVLEGHRDRVRRVSFSPSARLLASASYDGTARVWDLDTREAVCVLDVAGASGSVTVHHVFFSPAEDWLLTASDRPGRPLEFWDPGTCRLLASWGTGEDADPVKAATLARSPDGPILIALGTEGGRVQVLRLSEPGAVEPLCALHPHTDSVQDLSFSPNGRRLASASEDGRIALVDIGADGCGEALYLDGHRGSLYSVEFDPGGGLLLSASLDGTARLWGGDGSPKALLTGHKDRIYRAVFSPDGDWILTASRDGTLRLWKTSEAAHTDELAAYLVMDGGLGGAAYAAFSPDGHLVAGAFWENAAMLWRLWSEDDESPARLLDTWGPERSRLAIVREADRFRRENRLDDRVATED